MVREVVVVSGEEPPFQLGRVTLIAGSRCPTCGQLPPAFDSAFSRLVDLLWVDPGHKGVQHFTGDGKGGFYAYVPEDPSPPGLYSVIIVPRHYLGKVLWLKEEDDLDRGRRADRKRDMEPPHRGHGGGRGP